MITIVKGKEKIVCSYKTYDEQFKQLGYVPVSDEKKTNTKVAEKISKEEIKEEAKEVIVEPKKEVTEEEKIGTKYGVRKRTTSKKED